MAIPAVTSVEFTSDTVVAIIDLEAALEQRGFVAPNAVSIAEAYFERGAWFRAVQADGEPVGFVMLFHPTLRGASLEAGKKPDDIELLRLMIDHRHQRGGIGRKALDLVVAHARSRPGVSRLTASYVPGPGDPSDFYLNYGFVETGDMDGVEVVIAYPL